ncbi:MAG: hypothetical protein KDK04_07535 [Candidatus Competibacteraceae bacterium]|nr:hypothetical protein [Candidatus Competibacteraceae bacterium]MCB1804727.1 hypothetical protein [Candidatus Competibacteraceae bacterium]MCB1811557.1 hypothetical protein [Candidatus Competibacteraceae bacterium]
MPHLQHALQHHDTITLTAYPVRLFALVMMLCLLPLTAQAVDLHRLWEDRCGDCHGHAGEFAHQFLSVSDGKLRGSRVERDLHGFLQQHYLQNNEVNAVYDMLLAQASTTAQFKTQCAGCHASAVQLVHKSLVRTGEQLYIRGSQQSLADFMQHHRHLDAEQISFFVALLERVERELNQP